MERKVVLAAAGVSVVMILAWWFLMWSPAGTDIEAANRKYDSAATQATALVAQVSRLEATEARMPEMQSRLQTLSSAIPDSPDMSEVLLALDEAEKASGLDFLTHTAEEPQPGVNGVTEIGVQITGAGGYFQMLDFINRLQAMHRILVIDSITAAGAAQAGPDELLAGPPDLNVTITGRLFVASPVVNAEGA